MNDTHESLDGLRFDNSYLRELPADPDPDNCRRQVFGACHSRVEPEPVPDPQLVAASGEVMELLGLAPSAVEDPRFSQVFGGNTLLDGMEPYASCYGGHQFGNWAGQLGDGRAISLGEALGKGGLRWELQLKGAGPTPYSRRADGRAVLRSSIREFLCSEAMHHLGVPTTRALSLVTTGQGIWRDMLYDGNPAEEPGAVVCRVAPSFIRFGNFQIFASRKESEPLRALADHTLRRHFPGLGQPGPAAYVAMFEEVCQRTALMIAHWMRVGFVHGVMNTDNMSILGLTIDFGPYGWLDNFDPDWTPNTTDARNRRYRFGFQPRIAHWNLTRLAEAFVDLVGDVGALEKALDGYVTAINKHHWDMTMAKLGLTGTKRDPGDEALAEDMIALMVAQETDMTLFYRGLAEVDTHGEPDLSDEDLTAPLVDALYDPNVLALGHREALAGWLRRYAQRTRSEGLPQGQRRQQMNAVNPLYVMRNYLAQLAIDKSEQGDHSMVRELLDVMRNPYTHQPGRHQYAKKRPDWARARPGCSMLSCSS